MKKLIPVIIGGAALFVSGIAVGQKANSSKFEKYLRTPSPAMTMATLEANVALIQALMPMPKGIYIPAVYYDVRTDQMRASLDVSEEFQELPLDTAKSEISERAALAFATLKVYMPEVKQEDFVLTVYRFTSTAANGREVFAEYKNGNTVFGK